MNMAALFRFWKEQGRFFMNGGLRLIFNQRIVLFGVQCYTFLKQCCCGDLKERGGLFVFGYENYCDPPL